MTETLRRDAAACRQANAAIRIAANRRGFGWAGQYGTRTLAHLLTKFADSLDAEAEAGELEES